MAIQKTLCVLTMLLFVDSVKFVSYLFIYCSLVTTTLVGHSNMDQLQQSLEYFTKSKPLSDDIMWEIDIVHMKNRLPIFSSDRVGKDWNGEGEIGETIP